MPAANTARPHRIAGPLGMRLLSSWALADMTNASNTTAAPTIGSVVCNTRSAKVGSRAKNIAVPTQPAEKATAVPTNSGRTPTGTGGRRNRPSRAKTVLIDAPVLIDAAGPPRPASAATEGEPYSGQPGGEDSQEHDVDEVVGPRGVPHEQTAHNRPDSEASDYCRRGRRRGPLDVSVRFEVGQGRWAGGGHRSAGHVAHDPPGDQSA